MEKIIKHCIFHI